MRLSFIRWKSQGVAVAAAGALVAGAVCAPGGTALASSSSSRPQQAGGVSPIAAEGTPQLHKTQKGQEFTVRQIVQCGTWMYAVGNFTSISQGSTVYTVDNIFRFEAASPYTVDSSWFPRVNGKINSIALNSSCTGAYVGGTFSSVNGIAVKNIAEISTTTGDVVPAFGTDANNQVETLAVSGQHLLVGGYFTKINGSKNPYMASLNQTTGQDDGFLNLEISGAYHYCQTAAGLPYQCTSSNNHSMVYNQQISHSGTYDLVEGRFTSVGGQPRRQIFMLDLATSPATVTGWTSPEWDGSDPSMYPDYNCVPIEAFYIRSAAWSPDDSTVYIADTGYHPNNEPVGQTPRTGLCDAAAAFPATATGPVTANWIEYTGCDSYYSVAADDTAVYVAGHPRWAENPNDCDAAGPGAVADPGLQGLNPANGQLLLNSLGTPLYTMTRANADGMIANGAGLWIASTNRYTINKCGDKKGPAGHNAAGHAGICFLPYSS